MGRLAGMVVALGAIVLISVPDRRLGTPVMPTYHGSRRGEWLLIIGAALGFGAARSLRRWRAWARAGAATSQAEGSGSSPR